MMKLNFLQVLITNTLRPVTLVVAAFLLPGLAISADPLDKLSPDLKEELAYTTGVQAFIYAYPLLHVIISGTCSMAKSHRNIMGQRTA